MNITAFTTNCNSFLAVGQPGHGFLSASPYLCVNGVQLSLAGLALPLLISLILLRGLRVSQLPRSILWAVVASWVFNVALVLYQGAAGFPGGSVHLMTFVPVLPSMDAWKLVNKRQPEYPQRLLLAMPGLAFLSMLPTDLFSAVLMSQQLGDAPLHGLAWVGGSGWRDGLLLGVLSTAILVIFKQLVQRLTATAR